MNKLLENNRRKISQPINLIRLEILFAIIFCQFYTFFLGEISSIKYSEDAIDLMSIVFSLVLVFSFLIKISKKILKFFSSGIYLFGMLYIFFIVYDNEFSLESFIFLIINYIMYCFAIPSVKIFFRLNIIIILALVSVLFALDFKTEVSYQLITALFIALGFAGLAITAARNYYRNSIKERSKILSIIFNNSSEGLILINTLNNSVVEANDTAAKIFNYDDYHQVKGKNLEELSINDILLFKDLETGIRKTIEVKDDKVLSVLVKKIENIDKNLRLAEITEHKNRQELSIALNFDNLKSITEESYESLFNNSASLICIIDRDNDILDVNKTLLDFLGYSSEELIGKKYYEIDYKNYITERSVINQKAWEGETQLFEKEIVAKNGDVIFIEVILRKAKYFGKDVLISNSRDISQRKMLQRIAEYNYSQYSILFKVSPVSLVISDLDGDILEINASFEKLLGYTRNELLGVNIRTFSDAADMRTNIQLRERLISGSIPYMEMQKRYIAKNGNVVHALLKVIIQKDEDNNASKLLAQIVDITEFVKAERKLKESEKSYRDVFNNSFELLYLLDREGKFLDINKAVLDEYGYKKEEIIGKEPLFLGCAEKMENVDEIIEQIELAWEGKDQKFLWWSKRKDGTSFPKNLHIRKGVYFGQEVLMCSGRNISDEFEVKQQLLTSEKKYKDLIHQSIFGIIIFRDNYIVFANNRAVNLLEYKSLENLLGKHRDDVIQTKNIEELDTRVENIKAGKDVQLEEFELITAKRSVISVESKPSIIEYEGEQCILSSFVDISDRKQAEFAEQKIKEAKSVNLSLKQQLEQNRLIQRRLQNSQSYSEGIIESSLDMIFTTDIKGKITKLNGAAKKELQLERNDFLKMPFEILLKDKSEGEGILEELNRNNAFSGEIEMRRKDGTFFLAFLSISYLFNTDGAFLGIMGVSRDISDITSKEQEIKEQASKLTSIIESSSHFFFTINKNYRVTSFNKLFKEDMKEKLELEIELYDDFFQLFEFRGKYSFEEFKEFWKEKFDYAFSGGSIQFEIERISLEGVPFYREIFLNPIYSEDGNIEEVSGIGHDTTQKKLYEIELTNSLNEKDILLKEVHHRVKNNMQVISSILNLQSAFVSDESVLAVLRESQNRIRAMASIHERLYRTKNFSDIKFSAYVKNLAESLVNTYELSEIPVKLFFTLDEVFLTLNTAIPCGLIINELISNCLKYAFVGREEGLIEIGLKQDNKLITLTIGDDGVGIPDDVNFENTDTLGLQLVSTLVEQIEGKVELNKERGTKFSIIFNSNLEE